MLHELEYWDVNDISHRDMRVIVDANETYRYTFLYASDTLTVIFEHWIKKYNGEEETDHVSVTVHNFNLSNLTYIYVNHHGEPKTIYLPKDQLEYAVLRNGIVPPPYLEVTTKEKLKEYLISQCKNEIIIIGVEGRIDYHKHGNVFLENLAVGDRIAVFIRPRSGKFSRLSFGSFVKIQK